MDRVGTINLLRAHEHAFKQLGVKQLFLFGSVARGDATDQSDIDLFFDYERGVFGLFDLMDVKAYAAKLLGRPTDIMTRDSLHHALRAAIEDAAVRVF